MSAPTTVLAGARSIALTRPPDVPAGPVVVATAGTEVTDAAVRLAALLADGADVHVVVVREPAAPSDVAFTTMPPPPHELLAAERDALLEGVRRQLRRLVPGAAGWPVTVVDGPCDEAVARFAEAQGARVLVVGRGRHGLLGRFATGETVLRTLRRTDVPVLAVEPGVHAARPRRVVCAVDFSPYSTYAARVAIALAAPDAHVTLAHVHPTLPDAEAQRWVAVYEHALPDLLDEVRDALQAPADLRLDVVELQARTPGRAVIEYAGEVHADLVACGTHGYGFLHRLVLGSVATELLRGAPCSLLCVPGVATTHAATRAVRLAHLHHESIPSTDWGETLADVSRRDTGRLCSLDVVAASGESLPALRAVPLDGFVYEPAERAVTLLVGGGRADAAHLAHTVREVVGIDRLRDGAGVDRALRIARPDETLVLEFV